MSDEQALRADRSQIERFVRSIFKHATYGYISFRAFTQGSGSEPRGRRLGVGKDGKRQYVWPSAPIKEVDRVIKTATEMATWCATDDDRIVFAPPVCTLTNPASAATADIAEGVALSLECDGPDDKHPNQKPPQEAQDILRIILGPPTVALASGSLWVDPETGEQQPKWHLHYRLRVPTRDPDAHQRLREARNLAARLVGSDRTASSLVHPLRWAGSWNRKAEPRMAKIIEVNEDVEIDLDETLDLLRQVATEMRLETRQNAPNHKPRFDYDSDDDVEAKAIAALSVIPNNLDYFDWVNIGMEIHSAFGGSGKGYDLWHEFSSQWPTYRRSSADAKWNSFHSGGSRTAASLFARADNIDPSWRDQFRKFPGSDLPGAQMTFQEMLDEYRNNPPSKEEINAAYEAEREWIRATMEESAVVRPEHPKHEPFDIFGKLTPEPSLARHMLPEKIADFVYEQSDLLGCDPGAMAVAAIALCSSLISDSITLMPKRYDTTYRECARLWVILAGPVSSKKTPMLIKLNAIVKKIEEQMRREDAYEMENYKNRLVQYEMKKKIWDKRMADDDEDVSGWPPEKPERPPRRRLITNDFTVESLAPILCDNPRGLLIELDEIMQLFGGMDAYKASGVKRDRAAILQLWNGGFRAIDRVRTQDEPICVPNWGAGIVGGIQYEKLDQIGSKLVDDGLLQRFIIVPMKQAEREADRPPNADIISTYNLLIESLIQYNPIDPVPIRLSEAAQQYRDHIEELIRAFESLPGLSDGFRGHAGKMGAIFARLLLTLHVVECSPVYQSERIAIVSSETARRAYNLMVGFLIPHALRQYERIYKSGGDQLSDDTRWLAGHILARSLDKVNQRVCHDGSRNFKKDPKRAERAIQGLQEANWLSHDGNVNPCVHELFVERAEHERQVRDEKMARIKKAQHVVKQTYR